MTQLTMGLTALGAGVALVSARSLLMRGGRPPRRRQDAPHIPVRHDARRHLPIPTDHRGHIR